MTTSSRFLCLDIEDNKKLVWVGGAATVGSRTTVLVLWEGEGFYFYF